MTNTTLEEEAKTKVMHDMYQWLVGLKKEIKASDIQFDSAWRVGRDESRAKALINQFMDMEKKNAFSPKRAQVLDARNKGKWLVCRDSEIIVIEKRVTRQCTAYETLHMTIWNCDGSLRADVRVL